MGGFTTSAWARPCSRCFLLITMLARLIQASILATCCLSFQVSADTSSSLSVTAGARIYAQCMGCHSPSYHRTGPKHCGLFGRRMGSVVGFTFTSAMKDSCIIWSQATLDRFLKAPLEMVPNTSMGFAGISSATDRSYLIDYLASLTDANPICR